MHVKIGGEKNVGYIYTPAMSVDRYQPTNNTVEIFRKTNESDQGKTAVVIDSLEFAMDGTTVIQDTLLEITDRSMVYYSRVHSKTVVMNFKIVGERNIEYKLDSLTTLQYLNMIYKPKLSSVIDECPLYTYNISNIRKKRGYEIDYSIDRITKVLKIKSAKPKPKEPKKPKKKPDGDDIKDDKQQESNESKTNDTETKEEFAGKLPRDKQTDANEEKQHKNTTDNLCDDDDLMDVDNSTLKESILDMLPSDCSDPKEIRRSMWTINSIWRKMRYMIC